MLKLTIEGIEMFDERTEEFLPAGETVELWLEHSLLSLSKWESLFQKPFLSKEQKSYRENMAYIQAMILTPEYPPDILARLTPKHLAEINAYIESAQSATTFGDLPEQKGRAKGETITAELIYYWMVAFNIPFETERWHLNRLFALIKVCNIKNSKPKKRSKQETARRYRELNEQRRQELGTRG